jgi:valyl-tRNA synthetase
MELDSKYTPSNIESKWYKHWMEKDYFSSTPDEREPYSIVIPPPNVTGVLHMGHMLNNTIQDVLIRKARLDGKNACWVPGTDHASIATEAKVVKWLREEKSLKKSDLTRDEFLQYAWQWKEKYGGIILSQLQKLGASCDWKRTAFTMDEVRSDSVIKVFVDLYKKGKLYRGLRMVNWDSEAKTVLSNEEVIHGEEQAALYHVRYKIEGTEDEWITIATQRPETIMGDTGIAVHPKDPRYAHLKGKKAIVPLVNRAVPIIFDEYIDIDFGTGALKVTPAHDQNDYDLGLKHGLEVIDTLNEDGTMSAAAQFFVGEDRFVVRKKIKKSLEESGNLVKIEDYKTNIGRSERTNTVVEPRLSLQWYVDMKKLAKPALDSVMSDEIEFFPKNQKNIYAHWMENIRDWCISRQLWWGHRIPAFYYNDKIFVEETAELALAAARKELNNPNLQLSDLRQDEDVLDTWFSSWLWPISVFDGYNPDSKDFPYYYPTNVLVTGWDIIFLWVARMAMAGYEWKHERPFQDVYFTGMVRDKQRRKMSKSLGNSPDALELIGTFGADGVRFGMLSCSPAGGDLLFDDKLCEQGRNFCNKLWNALRLIKGWEVVNEVQPESNKLAIEWFNNKFQQVIIQFESNVATYRLSEALMDTYKFIWDDFCSWYLEMIKPEYQKPIDKATLDATIEIFEQLMVVLHPFMPFITEEIWHQLKDRKDGEDCIITKFPKAKNFDTNIINTVETAKDIISKVRDVRSSKKLKMRDELPLSIKKSALTEQLISTTGFEQMVKKMAFVDTFHVVDSEPSSTISFISGTEQLYVTIANDSIDAEEEKAKLLVELSHAQGFIKSIESKLNNEKFVAGAPTQVVDMEKKKLADGMSRLKMIEDSLAKL